MKRKHFIPTLSLALLSLIIISSPGYAGSTTTLKALIGKIHFHGIAIHPTDPGRFYLATHHGFFQVKPGGSAEQLSNNREVLPVRMVALPGNLSNKDPSSEDANF